MLTWSRVLLVSGFLAGTVVSSGCRDRGDGSESSSRVVASRQPRYGELMSEVGHRFELLGRAGAARRWDLASFELHELEEVFAELPDAEPPDHTGGVELRGVESAFRNTHPPELRAALASRDAAGFAAAFARTASTCNGCHRATGHVFIEIPDQPGAGVPKLDPVP